MASLKYTTGYQKTTISTAYTAGDTSIIVAGADLLPATGDFWVGVGNSDPPDFVKKVTANAHTAPGALTVPAGVVDGTDANEGVGVAVQWVLPKDGLDQLRDDIAPPFYGIVPPPAVATWTKNDGPGDGTFADTTHGIMITVPAHSGNANRLLEIAYPAGAFTLYSGGFAGVSGSNYHRCGFNLRDSVGGKMISWGWCEGSSLIIAKWTNITTYDAAYWGGEGIQSMIGHGYWKFVDDGTYLKWYVSLTLASDEWRLLTTQNKNAYCTPNKIGIHVNPNNATYGDSFIIIHWNLV